MSRPDQLLEYSLENELIALQREIDELKSRQFVGSASLLVKNNGVGTPPTWDVDTYALADLSDKQWRVTFTPTSARDSYAELQYVRYVSGGNGFESFRFYPDIADTSSTSRSWIFNASTSTNPITLSLKFYVKSIDTGVISVVGI